MNPRQWGPVLARYRSLMLFAVALLFGALAVYGARGYISERLEVEKARLQPKRQMAEVVVAKRDLERGERIGPDNMAVRSVPLEYLPGSAVRPEHFEQHAGARLALPMRGGEPLLSTALTGAETGAFSSRIRQGIRAMSIAVDEVNSVSGMLQPGDRIDLLFSVRPPGAAGLPVGGEITTTLMQDLSVLATGRQVRPGVDETNPGRYFTTITVEVTPEQAQRLIVAQRAGKLTAMLRHPDDRQPVGQRLHDVKSLLGLSTEAPLPAVRTGPEVIVGGRGTLTPPLAAAEALARQPAAELPLRSELVTRPAAVTRAGIATKPESAAKPEPAAKPESPAKPGLAGDRAVSRPEPREAAALSPSLPIPAPASAPEAAP